MNLSRALPDGVHGAVGRGTSAAALARMSSAVRAVYAQAFATSLGTVFLVATVVCAVGVVLSVFLPERPLRETVAVSAADTGSEAGGAIARPTDDGDAQSQLVAAFVALSDRDVQRQHIARIVASPEPARRSRRSRRGSSCRSIVPRTCTLATSAAPTASRPSALKPGCASWTSAG